MKKPIALLLCIALILSFSLPVRAASLTTERYMEKIEVLSKRTIYSKTYLLPDGSYEFVSRAEPFHYKASSGALLDIDNAITDSVDRSGYKYTNTANRWNAHFAEKLDDSNAVLLTSGAYAVSFSLVEQTGFAGVVKATSLAKSRDTLSAYHQQLSADDRAVLYRDVADNVDIAYTVHSDALKEDIILKSRSAPSVYQFRLITNGLTISSKDGKLSLCTAAGEEVFSFAPLYMVDANGKRSDNVSLTYTSIKNGYALTVSADTAFLNAKDTAYPVVIDPSVTISGALETVDAYVDEQNPNANYYMYDNLWTGGQLGSNARRTYLKFYVPSSEIWPEQVIDAHINLRKMDYDTPTIQAYRVTGAWSSDSITWNTQPSFDSNAYTDVATSQDGDVYTLDVTDMVTDWLDYYTFNYGLVLKEVSENDSDHMTKFYSSDGWAPYAPELIINYESSDENPNDNDPGNEEPYYGSRPFQYIESGGPNCMGYALEYDANIDEETLGIDTEFMRGMNIDQIHVVYENRFIMWMYTYLEGESWESISYSETVDVGCFKAFYVISFLDYNGSGIYDASDSAPAYHWYYQTSDGTWATKVGSGGETCRADDALTGWQASASSYNEYIYGCFEICDIRDPNWTY